MTDNKSDSSNNQDSNEEPQGESTDRIDNSKSSDDKPFKWKPEETKSKG